MNYLNEMLSLLRTNCQSKLEFQTKRLVFEELYNKVYKLGFFDGIKNYRISSELKKSKDGKHKMSYMGITVHKNTNASTWYARFRAGGKQYYISDYTQAGCFDKLVQAKSEENIKKLLQEQKLAMTDFTLAQWYEKWLNLYKINKVSRETLRSYSSFWNSIPDELKNTKMRQIKLHMLIEFFNTMESQSKQKKMHDFLSMMLNKAVDNEIITINLLNRVDKPKHRKMHSKALTIEEQNKLIDACKQVPYADLFAVALYQGFRRGEVLGITRDCVDYERKKIKINKAWSQRDEFDKTKNEQSVRVVPMFDKTYKIMLKYKSLQGQERIFDVNMKRYEKLIKEVRRVSGLPKLMMKDLRCTFVTNCRNKNIPLHIVQSWVGHQIGSIVTSTIYTSYMENADSESIKEYNKFANKNYK